MRIKSSLIYALVVFVLSILIGYLLQIRLFSNYSEYNHATIMKGNWWFYFSTNIIICTFMFLGVFTLSITTIPLAVYNGIVIGNSLGVAVTHSLKLSKILLAILPHGIFEIPAIIISISVGLQGINFYKISCKKEYLRYLGKMYGVVFILLFLASLVESYVSFLIAGG
ncbi:stage II sporulation protein M [Geobacillus icigianus]|nr:stage II sporulation protein M [Geobacillus icigianus]MEB3749166.1 hypothetical protein [Geobacillus icigianus]